MTRSSSDRQRTASFLKAILPTDCVLLESQLVNELCSSFAQTSCKECAALRQAARSALRSAVMQGSTFTAYSQLVKKSVGRRSEERRVGKECRSRWSPYH